MGLSCYDLFLIFKGFGLSFSLFVSLDYIGLKPILVCGFSPYFKKPTNRSFWFLCAIFYIKTKIKNNWVKIIMLNLLIIYQCNFNH